MSRENLELVHQAVDAFNRRDLDAFLALCDPNVEAVSRLVEVEGGGSYRGHRGIRSWWEGLLAISPDLSAEIEEVRDLGDVTVARLCLRGHGAQSDIPMEQTQWHVSRWRSKKSTSWRVVLSEAEALEAAGLSE